jgi:hypothetical protein
MLQGEGNITDGEKAYLNSLKNIKWAFQKKVRASCLD